MEDSSKKTYWASAANQNFLVVYSSQSFVIDYVSFISFSLTKHLFPIGKFLYAPSHQCMWWSDEMNGKYMINSFLITALITVIADIGMSA